MERTKWRIINVSRFYKQCLGKGHKPIVVRATFNLIYVYCNACSKVYRIRVALLEELDEKEWPGKPLIE